MWKSLVVALLTTCYKSVTIEAETGRVIESIDSISETDYNIRSFLPVQIHADEVNRNSTPQISSDTLMTQATPLGSISFGEKLHTGATSTVFTINEFSDLLIKFQAICEIGNHSHPLIRDFFYTNRAHRFGLSPKALFLSPPSLLCERKEGKCGFTMSVDDFESCRSQNRTLRYMIMDRAEGLSLHDFRMKLFKHTDGAIGLKNAVILGYQLIELLQRLHTEAGIVHGDIHSPNVMIMINENRTAATLQLIDFGLAFRNIPVSTRKVNPSGSYYHELHTIYQMYGYSWSARDDILKAIQTIAHLMQPIGYFKFERDTAEAGSRVLEQWKQYGNWFVTDLHDPVKALPDRLDHLKEHIYKLLDEVLATARSIGINGPIPYGSLQSRLQEIARLVV